MPLMLLNLRALPDGLASHKQFLKTEVDSWLTEQHQTDVMFICSSVDTELDTTVTLAAHQAVLAPVSDVLKKMFESQTCGHVRSMVHISIDCDPKVCSNVQ